MQQARLEVEQPGSPTECLLHLCPPSLHPSPAGSRRQSATALLVFAPFCTHL